MSLSLRFDVACAHHSLDVSADVKVAFNLYAEWIAGGDEVFQDDIDHVLVEDLHVPERVYVEFQTLQFDATFVGNVRDPDRGEVGKVGERADRREFGDLEIYFDFAARELVRKRFQWKQIHLRARRGLNFGYSHRATILTEHLSTQQLATGLHDYSGLTCKSCAILQSCKNSVSRCAIAASDIEKLDQHKSRNETSDVGRVGNAALLRATA